MPAPVVSREEFASIWAEEGGSATRVALRLGLSLRGVFGRRARMVEDGEEMPGEGPPVPGYRTSVPVRHEFWVTDGSVVIGSDRHVLPGDGQTRAEAALLRVTATLREQGTLRAVVMNGDLLDFPRIGRHDPFGWEDKPEVAHEVVAGQAFLARWREAAGPEAMRFWTQGNHDLRFSRMLATKARDFRGLPGLRLEDHFADWPLSWSLHVNPGTEAMAVVKHRLRGGVTAGRANANASGVTIVTGHTHSLSCDPIEDYRGRRWGVQCGMLGDPDGPQFEYAEDAPNHGRPGFAVLTWRKGVLQPPELCEIVGDKAFFRGDVLRDRVRIRAAGVTAGM